MGGYTAIFADGMRGHSFRKLNEPGKLEHVRIDFTMDRSLLERRIYRESD